MKIITQKNIIITQKNITQTQEMRVPNRILLNDNDLIALLVFAGLGMLLWVLMAIILFCYVCYRNNLCCCCDPEDPPAPIRYLESQVISP